MTAPILLLEDDPGFGYILSEYLQLQQFQVTWVRSAEEALDLIKTASYSLAILDVMLPGMDGFELATKLRQGYPQLPFIFLSARSLKVDQLKGFKLGAVDYITKPVDEELLVAKIRALLQRVPATETEPEAFRIGSYTFKPESALLLHPAERYKLTTRETALLQRLCQKQNQLLSRQSALKEIWGTADEFSRKSMDVFISKLRKYLSRDAGVRIENVHGKGFILVVEAEHE